MALDFPSFMKALSPIVKSPYKNYLRNMGYSNIHDFIDETGEIVARIWKREAFSGDYIFTRGTGAAALYILLPWLQHAANELGSSLEDYLKLVARKFPLKEWRSGRSLALPKGAGAGKRIADTILKGLIPELEKVPQRKASDYLEKKDPFLLRKLLPLFSPSGWKPLRKEFTREETGTGVYLIVGVNKELNKVKIRSGQTTNLGNRLQSHLSSVRDEFPSDVCPIFYSTCKLGKNKLDTAERALFHLIPQNLRLKNVRHPAPCKFCDQV